MPVLSGEGKVPILWYPLPCDVDSSSPTVKYEAASESLSDDCTAAAGLRQSADQM